MDSASDSLTPTIPVTPVVPRRALSLRSLLGESRSKAASPSPHPQGHTQDKPKIKSEAAGVGPRTEDLGEKGPCGR